MYYQGKGAFAKIVDEGKAESRQFGRNEAIHRQGRMHGLSDVVQMSGEHASKDCMSHLRNILLVRNLSGFLNSVGQA